MSIEVEWARMTAPDLREIAARKGALAILPAGSLRATASWMSLNGAPAWHISGDIV